MSEPCPTCGSPVTVEGLGATRYFVPGSDPWDLSPRFGVWSQRLEEWVGDTEAEIAMLKDALREIEALDIDWTQGVDENAERHKVIARRALAASGEGQE